MSLSHLRCISSSLKSCPKRLNTTTLQKFFKSAPVCFSLVREYSSKCLPEDHDEHAQPKRDTVGKPKKEAAKTRKRKLKSKTVVELGKESQKHSQSERLPLEQIFPFEGTSSVSGHSMAQDIQQVNSNGSRHYEIKCSQETYRFPSVTSVLEATMSREMFFRLHNWKKNLIKKHGESKSEDIARGIRRSGSNFHREIEQVLLEGATKEVISIKPYNKSSSKPTKQVAVEQAREASGYMQSVGHVLKDVSEVCAIESVVSHLELGYTGMFDCLAHYRGALCVIDWKTSSKPRPTLADCYTYPLQSAAYAGAINQDPHYPYQVRNALIVIVYPNGDPAHAHFLSHDQLLSYWGEWLQRLEQYQTQFASDLSDLYAV